MHLQQNNWKTLALCIVFLAVTTARSETVDIFFDRAIPQSEFAHSEIAKALTEKGYQTEPKTLADLSANDPRKRIVIALQSNDSLTTSLKSAGGSIPTDLGEQAYSLQTTTASDRQTYWILGGDHNGAMYGGLQLAEMIKAKGLSGTYNQEEKPHIKCRGVKYNLPLDRRCPTYFNQGEESFPKMWEGTSAQQAISHVWDYNYWTEWFDEMARARFNVISIWNCHPFPALLDMDEAFADIQRYDQSVISKTKAEKVKFWQDVMAYGKSRGFQIYFVTWNIYTFGVQNSQIDNSPKNQATKDYLYKAVYKMLETYPDLDGIGIAAGENMEHFQTHADKEGWLWDTYGAAVKNFAQQHPSRNITFIHRSIRTSISDLKQQFKPLADLPNVTFDMSYKYSKAHMYSSPSPRWIYQDNFTDDLTDNHLKTWLELRNDDFYFLEFGDPDFARSYIKNLPNADQYIAGFFYGSDGWTSTRDFCSKNDFRGMLEIKRSWFSQRIWGRLSYNPDIPDDVFIDEMKYRWPDVDANALFNAWKHASSGLPLATEVIQGKWDLDFEWYPELCQKMNRFLKAADFRKTTPPPGSNICKITDTAKNTCAPDKISALEIADQIAERAQTARALLETLDPCGHKDLQIYLQNISAQIHLSFYYADKIRGAVHLAAGNTPEAKKALEKVASNWLNYSSTMDALYTGSGMVRTKSFKNWHQWDSHVKKEYAELSGATAE